MAFLDITVSLDPKGILASRGHRDPGDTLAPQDLTVFQVKWVHLALPPWIMGSW